MPLTSAITICLVPEARGGPFVLHAPPTVEGFEAALAAAAAAGFDGVEIFPPSAAEVRRLPVRSALEAHGLELAAVGTGAGWVKHRLHLCHADPEVRRAAIEFVEGIVDVAGGWGAPAVVGSMQGTSAPGMPPETARDRLADALESLSARARGHGRPLLYEPLNRYETDLFNRQADAAAWLADRALGDVRLLCDLFHMNIEEDDVAAALVACGPRVGHVHFADSNRRAVGFGHTAMEPVVEALGRIGYDGFLSAEVLPLPTPAAAARRTIESFRHLARR